MFPPSAGPHYGYGYTIGCFQTGDLSSRPLSRCYTACGYGPTCGSHRPQNRCVAASGSSRLRGSYFHFNCYLAPPGLDPTCGLTCILPRCFAAFGLGPTHGQSRLPTRLPCIPRPRAFLGWRLRKVVNRPPSNLHPTQLPVRTLIYASPNCGTVTTPFPTEPRFSTSPRENVTP